MRITISVLSVTAMLSACVSQLEPPVTLPSDPAAEDAAVVITRGVGLAAIGGGGETRVSGDLTFATRNRGVAVDLISPITHGLDNPATYKIQAVPAGDYTLSALKVGPSEAQYSIGRWSQPGFSLRPGDVIYLGDIDLRYGNGKTEATVSDMRADAKSALAASRPDLAARMWTDLVDCPVCVHR